MGLTVTKAVGRSARALVCAAATLAAVAGGAVLTGGCSSGGTQPLPGRSVALGTEFSLAMSETVGVQNEGLAVTLTGVPEETRCPIDAICVSAGNAAVIVRLNKTGQAASDLRLNTNPANGPTGASAHGYTVRLTELQPYPSASMPRPPSAYVARLVVTKP